MKFAVVTMLLLCASAARADEAPPIDDAIARAAELGKPLVIEFGAVWCGPCRDFEANVLPQAEVITALQAVHFVRYDIDTAVGAVAARRFQVVGMPTFLVVSAQGTEVSRRVGIGPVRSPTWFLELLRHGQSTTTALATFEAAVKANPNDAQLRLKLARYRAISGRPDGALDEYRAVLAIPNVDRLAAAEAAAEIAEIEAAEQRTGAAVQTAIKFVEQHPSSPLAAERLALIVLSGRVERLQIYDLLTTHLLEAADAARPDALRVALLAGATTHARDAIVRWQRDTPTSTQRLMQAEMALARGDRVAAARDVQSACDALPAGVERWCLELQGVLRQPRGHSSPGVQRLREDALSYLDNLQRPGTKHHRHHVDSLARLEPALGNAIARAMLLAEQRCAGEPRRYEFVAVMLRPSPRGGRPVGVKVRSRGSPRFDTCIERVLRVSELPVAAVDEIHFYMLLERPGLGLYRSRGYPPGGVLLAIGHRMNAIDTYGFGVTGLVTVREWRRLQLVGNVHLEGVMGENFGYVARSMIGFLPRPVIPNVQSSIFVGLGASRFGAIHGTEHLPNAFEVPIELRIRVAIGPTRVHFWQQFSFILGNERQGQSALFDEATIGVGLVMNRAVPFMIGATYEDRPVGDAWHVFAAVPLGDYF